MVDIFPVTNLTLTLTYRDLWMTLTLNGL